MLQNITLATTVLVLGLGIVKAHNVQALVYSSKQKLVFQVPSQKENTTQQQPEDTTSTVTAIEQYNPAL